MISLGGTFEELAARMRVLAAGREAPALPEVKGRAWFDVQEDAMRLAEGLAERVEDATASNGQSVRMPGNHLSWATQYSFPPGLVAQGPWQVWAVVRVKARAAAGAGIQIGIFDWGSESIPRGGRAAVTKSIEELRAGAWHTVDLGVHALTGACYLWAAPCNNPTQVEAVFVDRFFFARAAPE